MAQYTVTIDDTLVDYINTQLQAQGQRPQRGPDRQQPQAQTMDQFVQGIVDHGVAPYQQNMDRQNDAALLAAVKADATLLQQVQSSVNAAKGVKTGGPSGIATPAPAHP